MGVNYTNITYDTGYPTAPAVQVNDSDIDIVVDGLDVNVSLLGPDAWTPTHYKLWNINGVTTSGAASWETYATRVSGTLINQSGKQYIYAQFKDASNETGAVTSSGVTFSWSEPTVHSSASWGTDWASENYGSASSATLSNATYNTDIVLSKSNIPGLEFGGKDFSDVQFGSNFIRGSSSGYLAGLLAGGGSLSVTKVMPTDSGPLVWCDKDEDGTKVTITKYGGGEKTGLAGDYQGRLANFSWTPGTKTLTFDITEFSQYGFTVVDSVEFTTDSTSGGYNGNSITLKVLVKDEVGEEVENAPVTITKISGDTIGNFSSNPVNTDANGIATFTLNLTAVGTCEFQASCDGVTDSKTHWSIDYNTDNSRSLLRQYEQIRWSETYDDAISNPNSASVAEPTVTSGSEMRLEHDMNVFRTLVKQFKGTTNWYDDLGTYWDPTATDSGNGTTKQMSLNNIMGKTTDSQTVLLAVSDDNSGSGFTTASGSAGILASITTRYATHDNRVGLPIYSSTGGDYPDEGGSDDVCVVDLIDRDTGGEFVDGSGNIIFGRLHDAADHGGTGSLTDVYVKFYTNAGAYTFEATDPTDIAIVYPHRKVMDNVYEWEWSRTDFVSSFEGDDELIEDISNLWSFTGAGNDVTSPTWTNTSNNYPLSGNPSDLEAAIDDLNDVIDDQTFTEDNYITDGDSVATSLDNLDMALQDVADSVAAGLEDIYVEELSADVTAGTLHSLPTGITYTPDSTSGEEGSNMDVFLDGQLLAASTGANGVNEDRDYAETTASGITFHMNVYQYSNVTYRVRQ